MKQEFAIDVKDWLHDPSYFHYPEGARPKRAYFPPPNLELDFIKPETRYLFKGSSNAPADQFWAEIVAYKIGCNLGVNVPPAFVAYDSITNFCGALIEWFYKDGEQRFVHGGDFLKAVISDFDSDIGTKHNLETIERICGALALQSKRKSSKTLLTTDYIKYWGEVFLFDSLIGNTDRHQNNWGFLRVNENNTRFVSLSPMFDNGTSLGSGRYLHKMNQWTQDRFNTFIDTGRHHMRFNVRNNHRPTHTEMIKHYINLHPEIKTHLCDMISSFSFESLEKELDSLSQIDLPVRLSEGRVYYYLKFTKMRFKNIKEVLK